MPAIFSEDADDGQLHVRAIGLELKAPGVVPPVRQERTEPRHLADAHDVGAEVAGPVEGVCGRCDSDVVRRGSDIPSEKYRLARHEDGVILVGDICSRPHEVRRARGDRQDRVTDAEELRRESCSRHLRLRLLER